MTERPTAKSIPQWVRKRDGRVEPFIVRKLSESVGRAASAAGIDDAALAQRLSILAAENAPCDDGTVASDTLYRMTLDVLTDTGNAAIAELYRSLRDIKLAARQRLWIRPDMLTDGLFPDVERVDGVWSRETLRAFLVNRLELDDATATDIARAVEQRLLATGLDGVSSDLVSAIVSHELGERGVPRRQDSWPRLNDSAGERFLFPGDGRTALSPLQPAGVESHIGAEFLSREAMDAHRRGILFIEGLPYGACLGQLAVYHELLAKGQPSCGSPEHVASQTAVAVCALAGLPLRPLKLSGSGNWQHRNQPRGAV